MREFSVILRPFEIDDHILINKWRNDPDIQRLVCNQYRYVSLEMEKQWVQSKMMNNREDIYLAICLNDETRKMIGYCSINNIDYINRSAFGGGIVIGDKEERNSSYIIDAGLQTMYHVFYNLSLHRSGGSCMDIHYESQMMMEMMGMHLDGIKRDALLKFGEFHDIYEYSILDTEFKELWENDGYSELAVARRLYQIKKTKKKNRNGIK